MTFHEEPPFPHCVSFGASGGPGYRTDVVVVDSGAEHRNETWSQSRCMYEVSHAAKLPHQYKPLQAFFRGVGGRRDGFRFQDPFDHDCLITEGVMLPVGLSTTVYQLYKRYTNGALMEDRIIQKPALGLVTLYKNAVALTYGGLSHQVTFDESMGLVIFNTAPGAATLAWEGPFDVPCRFDTDEMRGTIINKTPGGEYIMDWNSIPVIEIRLP